MPERPPAVVPEIARRAAESPGESALAPDVSPAESAAPAEPGAPAPDLGRTRRALAGSTGQTLGVTILAALAVLYTLYFARDFLVPIAFAILLNFLLSPLIRLLVRLRVRPPLGAVLVVSVLLAALGAATYGLSGPAQRWAAAAPESLARAEEKLRAIVQPVQQVSRTAEQVERAAGRMGVAPSPPPESRVVVHSGPSLASRVFGTTERLLGALLEVTILLYFLLAGGDLFLQKLIKVLPHFNDKVKAVEIARATESAVSAYLSTQLLINIAEGAVVTGMLWLIGLPSPAFWGVLVVFLEFVPYVGAATMVAVLSIAALTTFDSLGRALLAPASFLAVNLLQANVVTPLLLGHRLTLNPVAIIVGLAFFLWIWGVPGGFVAVPLLASFKILCDHITPLAAVGEFLGRRDGTERRVMVRPP